MVYLKDQDAAICIDKPRDIADTLRKIAEFPELITEYAAKAKACCQRNHSRETTARMIQEDFARYCQ